MRTVPDGFTDLWESGVFLGNQQYMARATIQVPKLYTANVGDDQIYAAFAMPQMARPRELPNIKSIVWDRDPNSGVAAATIILYNSKPLPLGATPSVSGRFDQPGYYTFNRGVTSFSDRWGHTANEWQGMLVYDRVIRTYEGYGFDPDQPPELDSNLSQTGTWLIDKVDYDTRPGLITVTCRDFGSLLVEDVAFVPVVPLKHYPLAFETIHPVPGPDSVSIADAGWHRPTYRTDSGYAGHYFGRNHPINGHQPSHAFDGSQSTYWLSIGNDAPSADYSFEYVEGHVSGSMTGVRVHAWGGPYRMYVSVFADGRWQGRALVPYDRLADDDVAAPNGAQIRYVKHVEIGKNETLDVTFPTIPGASRLRITMTHLTNSGIGTFPYRAGIRDVRYTAETITVTPTTRSKGNYSDYTDVVKRLLVYGGFWWPRDHSKDRVRRSDNTIATFDCPSDDPYLVHGRIWGDLEMSGVAGDKDVPLTMDIFDKKPLLDGINYVRDILGFIFMVDELGGAVFRSPNIWTIGNVIGDLSVDAGRTTDFTTIDEVNTLIDLTASVSGENVREHIFVANVNGRVGAVAKGHNPYPTGRRRTAGWTDQHFKTKRECQIMADLISLRQFMLMRRDTVTIAGNPGIQVDDQVRIIEEVTGEGYLHYVAAIHSEGDRETGRWTMKLSTNWLGENPSDMWLWDSAMFSDSTTEYLHALGKI